MLGLIDFERIAVGAVQHFRRSGASRYDRQFTSGRTLRDSYYNQEADLADTA